MHKTVVINAVGLTSGLLGPSTPALKEFAERGSRLEVGPVIPAVTTTVQSSYLTGRWPNEHGIVGNGWYFRDECEIKFWRQSNKLVQRPKIWEKAKSLDREFTCANLFWWYNMYSTADYTVTPRPIYTADGRKLPDIYTKPADLREKLQAELGQFPLFQFWGPSASIRSTQWIADAAMMVDLAHNPTLTLIYLPHLDYALQRMGPEPAGAARDLRELDRVCDQLIDHFKSRGAHIIILSEYGIVPVSRPVHLNRVLRKAGLLAVREELGHELLDPGASAAFAVADHQVAHIYINDKSRLEEIKALIQLESGVSRVLGEDGKRDILLDHPRSGDLIALAAHDSWFTYYYWLDDDLMPDFARTVDIHRKPGYDPAELFFDPNMKAPRLKVATALARRKLGFRSLIEVVPPEGSMVRGSHGLAAATPSEGPLLMSDQPRLIPEKSIEPIDVFDVILRHLLDKSATGAGVGQVVHG